MLDRRNSLATLVMTSYGALQFLSVMKGMFIEIANATEISVLQYEQMIFTRNLSSIYFYYICSMKLCSFHNIVTSDTADMHLFVFPRCRPLV